MGDPRYRKKVYTIGLLAILGIVIGSGIGFFIALTHDLPQIRSLETFQPSAVTRIYSADNVLLGELFLEKRDPVKLDEIPPFLVKALIATEDRSFYAHSGIDLKGIARAVVRDLLAGEFVEGASTLTQQLAKTLFLSPKKSLLRKMREAFLAFQLERRYTKEEILTLYLNQVYFGSGAYGVEAAARIFFGKPVRELDLPECAMVAGMPKAPSVYSPLIDPDLAVRRRNTVLDQMLETGIISAAAHEQASARGLGLPNSGDDRLESPYFVDYVKRILEQELGAAYLYKGGLTIYTSLLHTLQEAAEKAVERGLTRIEKRAGQGGPRGSDLQAALIAVGVESGGILAMVGGRDFWDSPFNRATQALRQPGSAFKPLVYAYAVEQGFPQTRLILDAPVIFKGGRNGGDWQPENFSGSYRGEITLREALAASRNIPAVRLTETFGPASVARFAHRLGIESKLTPTLALALGASEVTLMELTSAYGVFANHGTHVKPYGVMEVLDRRGRSLWRTHPERRIAMSRAGAAVMTDMLQAVIQEGTGRKARTLGGSVAGKTGTTNSTRDALFVGYSPTIAAGVWVGRDSAESLGRRETGASAALPIWIDFMETALQNAPLTYFDLPESVRRIRVDPATGRPAGGETGAVPVLVVKGTEPEG